MSSTVSPIPPGMHTLTPYLISENAADAIAYYVQAFGAQELARLNAPNGLIMHALLRIGDSPLMMSDAFPGCGGGEGANPAAASPMVFIHMYVEDVDAVFDRAVQAGAKVLMPVQDMFWGDRYGQLEDPFGHRWSLATHKEDLSPEEIGQRAATFSGGEGYGA